MESCKISAPSVRKGLSIIIVMLWVYGVSPSPICLVGNFESQVKQLLSKQMLTRFEVRNISTVFLDLQRSLRKRWPGCKVIPIGSTVTGLMMKSSDTDCMIKVPQYTIYNETANRYLILEAVRQLKLEELYDNVTPKFRPNKLSLLTFTHVPTQRHCDVNFINTKGLQITRMIARYYSLDSRAWTLAALIKVWSKVHEMKNKHGILDSYTLNLLIIFYLQQENLLPPFYVLQNTPHRLRLKKKLNQNVTVYQLLGGFFKYYSKFNYEEFVISSLFGRIVHKSEFEYFERLPEVMSPYKTYMRQNNSKPIAMNTQICVQDVFSQHLNVVQNLSSSQFINFITHVKFAAVNFKRLPKDRFLRALLIRDKYPEEDVVMDEVKSLRYCSKNSTVLSE